MFKSSKICVFIMKMQSLPMICNLRYKKSIFGV